MISENSAHSTSLPVGFRTWLWRYTCSLLVILMLWHRQSDIWIERRKAVFLCWMQVWGDCIWQNIRSKIEMLYLFWHINVKQSAVHNAHVIWAGNERGFVWGYFTLFREYVAINYNLDRNTPRWAKVFFSLSYINMCLNGSGNAILEMCTQQC